jgi:hypothetical protein
LVFGLAAALAFAGCRRDPEPTAPAMSFSAKINGNAWTAREILVQFEPPDAYQDSSLTVSVSDESGQVAMILPLFGFRNTGTFQLPADPGGLRDSFTVELTGFGGITHTGTGDLDYTLTQVGDTYEGTFSGTVRRGSDLAFVHVTEGRFTLFRGYCSGSGSCVRNP